MHANGTTRLQLNLVRSSSFEFDVLFSIELLCWYKPAPDNYHKALELLKLRPEECVTVAAHAYDLRGAKAVGIKTAYVRRWTEQYTGISRLKRLLGERMMQIPRI